jgi:predicted MFS family arabinose efflux permease
MMWTPIMRIVTLYYDDTATRERANGTLAMTLIVGHFGAWAISGFLGELLHWRFAFVVPALIALAVLTASYLSLRDVMADAETMNKKKKAAAHGAQSALGTLIGTGFPLVLLTCLLYGFIRDSIVTWSPTILARLSTEIVIPSTVFTLILPAINIFGVTIGFALRYRGAQPHVVVTMMMIVAILSGALLLPAPGILLTAVLLGLICAGMYGANTMLTALIPLQYDRIGRTGMTAGMVDSTIYAGSAIAGVLGGTLYEGYGTGALYGAWILSAIVCSVLMMTSLSMSRKYWKD